MAVWELGDVCLEIEAVPARPVQYLYVDERTNPGFSNEGDVSGNEANLRQWSLVIRDAVWDLHG